MRSGWKDVEVNALRAHLQLARQERASGGVAKDYAYSDEDIADMAQEMAWRRLARCEKALDVSVGAGAGLPLYAATAEHQARRI